MMFVVLDCNSTNFIFLPPFVILVLYCLTLVSCVRAQKKTCQLAQSTPRYRLICDSSLNVGSQRSLMQTTRTVHRFGASIAKTKSLSWIEEAAGNCDTSKTQWKGIPHGNPRLRWGESLHCKSPSQKREWRCLSTI